MDAPRLTLRTPCSPLLAISSLEHEKVRVPKHAHPGAVGRSVRPLTLLRPAVAGACWLDATIELNPMRTVEVAEAVLVLVALRSVARGSLPLVSPTGAEGSAEIVAEAPAPY